MTYGENIKRLCKQLSDSGHNVMYSINSRTAECTIDGIEWNSTYGDPAIALNAYLEGVWRGYFIGLKWAKDEIKNKK